MGYWGPQNVTIRAPALKYMWDGTAGAGGYNYMLFTGEGLLKWAIITVNGGGVRPAENCFPLIEIDGGPWGWTNVSTGLDSGYSISAMQSRQVQYPQTMWCRVTEYNANGFCVVEYSFPDGLPFKTSLKVGAANMNNNDAFYFGAQLETNGVSLSKL